MGPCLNKLEREKDPELDVGDLLILGSLQLKDSGSMQARRRCCSCSTTRGRRLCLRTADPAVRNMVNAALERGKHSSFGRRGGTQSCAQGIHNSSMRKWNFVIFGIVPLIFVLLSATRPASCLVCGFPFVNGSIWLLLCFTSFTKFLSFHLFSLCTVRF